MREKRPIALLSSLPKLLELIIVRRLLDLSEGRISKNHYAYCDSRSAEILLSGLDCFTRESRKKGRASYVVGLDVARSFDVAS